MDIDGIRIEWLGHAAVRIILGMVIYIDPYQVSSNEKADLILITHGHYDHCSVEDIQKIAKHETIIIATTDCTSKFAGKVEAADLRLAVPGKKFEVGEVKIEAVPAYNPKKQFHPKSNDWVGYIVEVKGKRIYHAGDTDVIPEMEKINADIALLPIGGTYTMTPEEAAEAANKINPKIAIPIHFGAIVGTKADAEKFKALCKCEAKILNPSV
ncbi:MBL fold metallo-hydrolase [Candidatus Woesearchaeota archaeon]|nr:MBL fold metallo-hydrolase [Candidatus Woesearchaeota archaeon]